MSPSIEHLKDLLRLYDPFSTGQALKLIPLSQHGESNKNYLLIVDDTRYVLKYFIQHGIDRQSEYNLQQIAHKNGISPKPILLDIKNSILVSEYIQGKHETELNEQQIKNLASTLKKLHAIKTEAPTTIFEVDTSDISKFEQELVLCHNDLNPLNILWQDNRVVLIDWEYAGQNDRYFDLASVVDEFNLEKEDKKLFVVSYFDGYSEFYTEKFHAYLDLYRRVCMRWREEINTKTP